MLLPFWFERHHQPSLARRLMGAAAVDLSLESIFSPLQTMMAHLECSWYQGLEISFRLGLTDRNPTLWSPLPTYAIGTLASTIPE
jgi:hypothetical protein